MYFFNFSLLNFLFAITIELCQNCQVRRNVNEKWNELDWDSALQMGSVSPRGLEIAQVWIMRSEQINHPNGKGLPISKSKGSAEQKYRSGPVCQSDSVLQSNHFFFQILSHSFQPMKMNFRRGKILARYEEYGWLPSTAAFQARVWKSVFILRMYFHKVWFTQPLDWRRIFKPFSPNQGSVKQP